MLDYNLENRGEASLYEYVYQQIRDDIVAGRIAAGEHLPSKRAFASHLGISVITIENAYSQLLAEGYICSKPRRGYYACELPDAPVLASAAEGIDRDDASVGPSAYDVNGQVERFDALSPSALEAARLWQSALRATLASEDEREIFSTAPAQGTARLRRAIAHHLRGTRGMNVDPDNIVIGAGAQLLDTMLVQLLGADKVYAVEDPGYLRLTRIYQVMGCEVRHVPLDAEGVDLSALQKTGTDVLHLMPSHQYPTGIVMPLKRRLELLRWANEKEGRFIIEDDYDSEFRYKGKPIPALQGYDSDEKVIYLGTFSKSIAPAIRLSYMVLPVPLLKKYRENYRFINSTVSKVDQLIVQKFIEEGYYERHLNKTRALYKNRHDVLIEALKPLLGRCRISGEHAGVHLLLNFKDGTSEEFLIRKAKEAGVRVYGMSQYRIETTEEPATILLGYANMSEEDIKEAVNLLNQCWTEL